MGALSRPCPTVAGAVLRKERFPLGAGVLPAVRATDTQLDPVVAVVEQLRLNRVTTSTSASLTMFGPEVARTARIVVPPRSPEVHTETVRCAIMHSDIYLDGWLTTIASNITV